MEPRFQIPIEVTDSVESAVKDADIIVLSTTATQPVLFAAWLRHGVHINSIASATPQVRELDSAVIEKSKIVVDSKEAALKEAGDLLIPLAQGQITTADIYGEVGEIAAGSKPGRTDGRETTVYKSVGLAIQDAAAAKWLFERARRLGYGLAVDL